MYQKTKNVNTLAEVFKKITASDIENIRNSDFVYITTANTGPSVSSPPQSLNAATLVGGGSMTVAQYKRTFSCGVNARNRLRAIAVATASGQVSFFDLDMCSEDEKVSLFDAIFSTIVICHQAQDFLGYMLLTNPGLQSSSVVFDVSMMSRALEPELFYHLAKKMVQDEVAADRFAGKSATSLQALCETLSLSTPAADFPNGRLWQLTELSNFDHVHMLESCSHLDALTQRLRAVFEIFGVMSGPGEIEDKIIAIRSGQGGNEFFGAFEPAVFELARIHARGLPIDRDGIDAVRYESSSRIPGLVDDLLAHVPSLECVREILLDEGSLAGSEVRKLMGGYCSQSGFALPCDDDGLPKIGFDAMTLAGADKLPGAVAWAALDDCKRERKEAGDMLTHSIKKDGVLRMHPVLAVTAVTGRTSCREPNAQGFSKRMKRNVLARPGFSIIEADAGAIEIRIAAAMSIKAFADAEKSNVAELQDDQTELGRWFKRVKEIGMPLVKLLRDGKCPHDHLSAALDITRDEAKLANFSMLYLITPSGLYKRGLLKGIKWTKERATTVHAGWLAQFPEVAFCAKWTQSTTQCASKISALLPIRYGSGSKVQEVFLHRAKTLGGRPLVTHDDRILNQIAQGSGATMILNCLVDLPSFVKDKVIMTVHDSIVLEVESEKSEFYAVELARAMSQTISKYLKPHGIPAVVDAAAGPSWSDLVKITRQLA